MELWKMLLITLLCAVVIGCVVGVLLGKHQLKKLSGEYRPLLSTRERIVYAACILLGMGCIAFGLLYTPPAPEPDAQAVLNMEDGALQDEQAAADTGGAAVRSARPRGGGAVVVVG